MPLLWGGYRFGFVTFPPAYDAAEGLPSLFRPAAMAEMEEKLPGFLAYLEPDNPGMHTTDTIDFEVVLSGEVILELDNGVRDMCSARATPWCRTGRVTAGRTGNRASRLGSSSSSGPTAPAIDPRAY